VFVHGVLK